MKRTILSGCIAAGLAILLSASPMSASADPDVEEVLSLGPISAMRFEAGWRRIPAFGGVKYLCRGQSASGTRDCRIQLSVGPNFSAGSPRDCDYGATVLVSGGALHLPLDKCAAPN